MKSQPVFVRRTVNGTAYWINVPTCVVRLSVWAVLVVPVLLVLVLVKALVT